MSDFNDEPTLPMSVATSTLERAPVGADQRETSQRPRMRLLGGVLLLGIAIAAFLPAIIVPRVAGPPLTTARTGNIVLSLSADGTLGATTYQADFPIDGTLSEVDATVGQTVRAGDVLAKLDITPFDAALTAAQNSDAAAQQGLTSAQSAQSQAQTAVDSASSALVTQQDAAQTACVVDTTSRACVSAEAAVAQAQAQLNVAQAQLAAAQAQAQRAQGAATLAQSATAQAQAQLQSATLVAPHDGVISAINGAVGGKPGATATGLGSFITIVDTTTPLATVLVGYSDIASVNAGQSATFHVAQASANATFSGAVTGVSPLGRGTGDHLSYPVYLRIDPTSVGGAHLRSGMATTARIITRARYSVVVVPVDALTYARQSAPADGSGALSRVQIADAQASAKTMEESLLASGFNTTSDPLTPTYLVGYRGHQYVAVPVVLGLSDGAQIEVVAGLSDGEQIATLARNPLLPASGS